MELLELLAQIDAPDSLVDWVRAEELDFDDAWARCARGDHRLWLAAIGGAPVETLIEASAAALFQAEERFAYRAEPVTDAITKAITGEEAAVLLQAAAAAEAVAEGGGATYRDPVPPGYDAIARGAGLLAHAAEGLGAAEAAREAGRLEEARHRGATLGVGASIALPARAGPARLEVLAGANDPAQGSLLFSVAAAAQAVLEAEEATAKTIGSADAARREADATVRAALEA